MQEESSKERWFLEITLICVCAGFAFLLHAIHGYRLVVLDLFFLPIVLAGFFLGRYHAGVMALLCVIFAACVMALHLASMAPPASPLVVALAITVWAAVLGLTALMVGTLSDDRAKKLRELHDAYVGVVEVLAQYLQSAKPHVTTRSTRVAELSQQVGVLMKLSPRQIDDIRVAALLHEMGNVEITTKVIRRAVGSLAGEQADDDAHTFQGADLMLSLGSIFSGAVPLLLNQDDAITESRAADQAGERHGVPLGATIIRAARAYCNLADSTLGIAGITPADIVKQFRDDYRSEFDADILDALERVVSQNDRARPKPTQADSVVQAYVPIGAGTD
ncbi:MAG TPA: HD domain-containing phosphohydrolase [Thermoguttaceae bacterium]|nr:HD domain-containing phosphohydrolase [Thermoguttaceae bacterium]